MDQTNCFYEKHGYQTVYTNSGSDYQTTGYSDHSLSHLHRPTGLINSNSTGSNSTCSDLSSASAANLSRPSGNSVNANSSLNDFTPPYRLYSHISDSNVQNVSSAPSNTSDCNNITYGGMSSHTYTSKSYEQTTNSAHVPVIAVSSNSSSHTRGYSNYGSYQNIDYSLHKSINQNYNHAALVPSSSSSSSTSSSSAQNRSTLNSSAAFVPNHPIEHILQPNVKSRSNNIVAEAKPSAKTSVIKPLHSFNTSGSVPVTPAPTPINYAKYTTYPALYGNTNKTASTLDKSPSTNRGNSLNSSTNHKDVLYCPEPISARYPNPGYALNVNTAGAGHASSHFLSANNYPLNYGHHHIAQQQNNIAHTRNTLPPSYQTSFDESGPANYFNRQNSLVVRPTPSTFKQNQIPYQNPYGYARSSNITNNATGVGANHPNNSHTTLTKPQSQKPMDDTYNSLALDFNGRNFRPYMYSSNYTEPAGYDDYTQYPGFTSPNTNSVSFYPTKAPSKFLYNYNPSLNMYNNSASHVHLSPQTTQSTATTTSSSTIQQPVPINPSSSQLISSNYDATSLHSHPMLQSALFNNNTKDYYSSNQYQQSPYPSQILYTTLQNGNYYPTMKPNQTTHFPSNVSDVHSLQSKVYAEKQLPPPAEKYSSIDLEEQINSSKIPKGHSGPMALTSKPVQRLNDMGPKVPTMNVQESQRQRKTDSSQNTIENNRNAYAYSNNLNMYSGGYQPQWQWQKAASSAPATTSSTTTHLHPKKQSLRDFLSTWNEFEEEDIDTMNKKASTSNSQRSDDSRTGNNNGIRFEKPNKIKENVPVIVQPLALPPVQSQIHASHLHSALVPSSYPGIPISNVPVVPPKMHVGITAEQNLPDIIIDIEKTKVGGEGECFERTNGKYRLTFKTKIFCNENYVFFSSYLCSSHSTSAQSIRKTVHSGFNRCSTI